MKKILFIFSFLFIMFSIETHAEEVKYKNLITNETTIEEDFNVLNLDINDYYQPKFTYLKWYVIGMSESYVNDTYDIQTYFYIYNPTKLESFQQEIEIDGEWCEDNLEAISLQYSISNKIDFIQATILDTNYEHHLLKVKGFLYPFRDTANIEILTIQNIGSYINGKVSESNFKATTHHSKLNGLSIELSFDSTLIIDKYEVVEIEVKQDDNLLNNWNSFWSMGETSMLVYFYNFNFPDHIKYDSVEYAKFSYYYNFYYEKVYLDSWDFSPSSDYAEFNIKELKSREKVVSEYNSNSKTLRVNKHSQELTFPTFYLGNRIKDKQFGTLEVSGALASFDYDCSVLLDSTFKTTNRDIDWVKPLHRVPFNHIDYTTLDEVELIELHYMHDGVLYKCQVVDKPVDEEDFNHGIAQPPKPEDPWYIKLWNFLIKIGKFLLNLIGKTTSDLGYGLIGIFLCIIGISCTPILVFFIMKFMIFILKIPVKILSKIFGG